MSEQDPVRTRPARRPAPPLRRFSSAVLADLAKRTRLVDPQLAAQWNAIAGDELAALCRPGRLTGGRGGRTLEIVVASGAAAARASFEAETIRRRANEFLGPGVVAWITVRQSAAVRPPPDTDAQSPVGAALGRFRASLAARERKG